MAAPRWAAQGYELSGHDAAHAPRRADASPPPRGRNGNGQRYRRRTPQAEPAAPIQAASPRVLGPLTLAPITDRATSQLYNEYLDRYHYIGYQPLAGAQQRYFVRAAGTIVALLGFGAAAWKCQPRDAFIGRRAA